jgi:hypothetical protein
MPELTPLEAFSFGGVDSRSNPLNPVRGRALRCRNFQPQDSGVLQLRYGFSTVTMSTVSTAAPYHDVIPYTLYDNAGNQTLYVIIGQGTTMKALNVATGAVTSPAVRGNAFASATKGAYYSSNNRIHFGNGTDQKWFDGTTWRDNGLRSLTTAEAAAVSVFMGLAELSTAQRSAVTLAQTASGGNFGTQSNGGMLFFVALFNTQSNELGPAPNNVGSGRIQIAAGNSKVTLGTLPAEPSNWLKLIARTDDGTAPAYFCTTAAAVAINTIARVGQTITFTTAIAHGRSTGDVVIITGSNEPLYNVPWLITVTGANTFTATTQILVGAANTTGGTVAPILALAGATTTVDVTLASRDTAFVVNDANRGIPASSVGGANPGYQIYVSIANPNGGGHVGNRVAVGSRMVTTARTNVWVIGLPDFSGVDSEWQLQIGRTGDGAQIPYASSDSLGNYLYAQQNVGQIGALISNAGNVDGTHELPVRNGIIPSGLNMFARVGGRIYGAIQNAATLYRSASELDATTGDFVGRPEQSWAANDIDTFPTAEGFTGMFEDSRGVFCASKNNGAVYADQGTGFSWLGPWYGAGMAGPRAWCDTPYGKFWVTGHKQVATFTDGTPAPVSDEYEAAELAKIGDANLSAVEMFHIKDVAKRIDHILIKALDVNGNPFEIIHDFRLRDGESPVGQAYEFNYSAPLATDFVLAKVRDASGAERLWAGASTGQLYQLHSGANDAGTEYLGDYISRINAGPNRPSVAELRWVGDQNVSVSIGRKLNGTVSGAGATDFEQLKTEVAPGDGADNFYYRAKLGTTEIQCGAFIRLQLNSHSADGNLDLNDPPHVPLEAYGRIYLGQGLLGAQRGA